MFVGLRKADIDISPKKKLPEPTGLNKLEGITIKVTESSFRGFYLPVPLWVLYL
jgi:hypothetical protein